MKRISGLPVTHAPPGFWSSAKNQKKFVDAIERELNINAKEDWYEIEAHQITKLGARTLLLKHGDSVARMLKDVYPGTVEALSFSHFCLRHRN